MQAFQQDAFQNDAFQVGEVIVPAFQQCAFQDDAFQILPCGIIPPVPPPVPVRVFGGGAVPHRFVHDVQALVRLELAALELHTHAIVEAGEIYARLVLDLALHSSATATPADAQARAYLALPELGLVPVSGQFTRKTRGSSRAQDEAELEAYYLALMDTLSRES